MNEHGELRRRSRSEQVAMLLLIVLGGVGLVIGLLDTFFDLSKVPVLKESSAIILMMVSVLTVAIGLERAIQLEEIANGVSKVWMAHERSQCAYVVGVEAIRRVVERHLQVGLLDNYDAIYDEAEELVKDAGEIIRGTAFSAPSVPRDYVGAIAERAKEAKERMAPIEYRVVVGRDEGGVSEAKRRFVETRRKMFAQCGIPECLSVGTIPMPTGLDLLVVDDRHLIIAFPTMGVSPDLRYGLVFFDQPELTSKIAKWYDEYLWSNRTPW